jgi:hypothetical protein
MASVLHLHFCWNENNGIPPELSEIKLRTFVNAHLADVPLHSLQELLSGRETIETHSLSLSDFIHST